jgi:hypothetical protein
MRMTVFNQIDIDAALQCTWQCKITVIIWDGHEVGLLLRRRAEGKIVILPMMIFVREPSALLALLK